MSKPISRFVAGLRHCAPRVARHLLTAAALLGMAGVVAPQLGRAAVITDPSAFASLATTTVDFEGLAPLVGEQFGFGAGEPFDRIDLVMGNQFVVDPAPDIGSASEGIAVQSAGIFAIGNTNYQTFRFTQGKLAAGFYYSDPLATSVTVAAYGESGNLLESYTTPMVAGYVGFVRPAADLFEVRIEAPHASFEDAASSRTVIDDLSFAVAEPNGVFRFDDPAGISGFSPTTVDFEDLVALVGQQFGFGAGQPYLPLGLQMDSQFVVDPEPDIGSDSEGIAAESAGIFATDNTNYQSLAFTQGMRAVGFFFSDPLSTSITFELLDELDQPIDTMTLVDDVQGYAGFVSELTPVFGVRITAPHASFEDAASSRTVIDDVAFAVPEPAVSLQLLGAAGALASLGCWRRAGRARGGRLSGEHQRRRGQSRRGRAAT